MYYKKVLIICLMLLPLICLQGCTSAEIQKPTRLQWMLAEGQKLTYKTHLGSLKQNDPAALYPLSLTQTEPPTLGFDALEHRKIYHALFAKLENQLLALDALAPTDNVRKTTTVERWHNKLLGTMRKWRVKTAWGKPGPKEPFATLHTVFNQYGELYGNHLERNYSNYEKIIYNTPPVDTLVGERWMPPQQLLGVNEGFVPTFSQKSGEGVIVKIWRDENGDRIVRTHLLIAERIVGYRKANETINDEYEARSAALFIKDFYLDKGYLKQLIGQISAHFLGSHSGVGIHSKKFALKLVE